MEYLTGTPENPIIENSSGRAILEYTLFLRDAKGVVLIARKSLRGYLRGCSRKPP